MLFKDFLGIIEPSDTASSSSSSSASGSCFGGSSTTSCAAQAVATATTHGKLWSCINEYFLNTQVPRTTQYGPCHYPCWDSGCSEFTVLEAMSPGSVSLQSALHLNPAANSNNSTSARGVSVSDYISRPATNAIKLVVVFNSTSASITVLVLSEEKKFSTMLSAKRVQGWLMGEKRISSMDVN